MVSYKAPLDDIRFCLYDLLGYDDRVTTLPGCEEATRDVVDAILEEGARFCENELLPLNQSGDSEGCHFDKGVVRTPKGFKEAYAAYRVAGWTGLAADPIYGGQGLPKTLEFLVQELICSTNMSFGMYPGLSHGAYNALETWGSDDLKARTLPHLADGRWAGTMCLTEPHCGTDLGLIHTRAEPLEGQRYGITGQKIFISAGEHDLTENILHLVLARLPDAPSGTRGISLFLVPKFLLGESGDDLGQRNGVSCGSIEEKMGIKASSTCVMNFDGAEGYLVGEPHGGMKAMFTMMNAARLGVGIQGLGLAETAYQSAVAYARERRQGRSLAGPAEPQQKADPIIVHPDVRKNLMTMRALNEGSRALAIWVGMELDVAERHPDMTRRQEADDFVALMTPVIKAFCTDHGFDAATRAQQIYGGHGYIKEQGIEQLVRDARITQIYEGTNGIQALDLVGRKLGQNMGRLLRRFFHPVHGFIEENQTDPTLAIYVLPLAKAFSRLQQATAWVAQQGLRDPEEAGAAASDYLRLFALVALAYVWARTAKLCLAKQEGDSGGFYRAKINTADFYMARILPESNALFQQIMAGKKPLMAMAADDF
ncbi:acyl-CoA dehydrogenase C-terminal domain-containing protein [Limibacillus halophilus]|uniref:3-methylmercaptopropionyl-CoA dehydrogenase n=1 Tax=Limibacillus halophilus TaxID=1579333 RepID=A0A839SPE7_9PROT|nr:acyl-CoA dehydrogenase C-terminal domain-containing protein [Limibacillus halophilus]MBB3064078.1 alkylation response protein AidB-like acyl-CoA dehydrogenase [Limibacillus halophilus]